MFVLFGKFGIYQWMLDYDSFPKGYDKLFVTAFNLKSNDLTFVDIHRDLGNKDGW
jgi:hypothetical protein